MNCSLLGLILENQKEKIISLLKIVGHQITKTYIRKKKTNKNNQKAKINEILINISISYKYRI